MLRLEEIRKAYRTEDVRTQALDGIGFSLDAGEFVAVMGPSGCGKSTLLNIVGLLDSPDSGSYLFDGEEVSKYSESKLAAFRRSHIGFVFQSFNLIDDLSVAENVDVALIYRRVPSSERKRRIAEVLERVGIAHRARHLPQQLSGGQQQRVAIARALVAQPKLILADEPTGNLDTANGDAVMELLKEVAAGGTAVLMVTHSQPHAAMAQRIISMLDGKIVDHTIPGA